MGETTTEHDVAPKIDTGESAHLHLVHSACQTGGAWYVTWCQIAVEPDGQRTEDAASESRDLCAACVDAVLATDGRCRLCGELAA